MNTQLYRFNELLDMVEALRGVRQREDFHPEGDAFNHSLQVFYHALHESNDIHTVLSGLLHDIGKRTMPIGHEEEAMHMLTGRVSEKTLWLIRNHLRVRHLIDGDMRRLNKIQELTSNPWFADLVLLARWDKMGRKAFYQIHYNREQVISKLEKLEGGNNGDTCS